MRFKISKTLLASLLTAPLLTVAASSPASAQTHALGGSGGGIGHLSSSNFGPSPFTGINLNTLVGADRFYNEGYTGTRAIIGNVEAGHIWNLHETLTHVTTLFDARDRAPYLNDPITSGQLGQFDFHATAVGHVIGGRTNPDFPTPNSQQGIAFGAELWSGAIATSWTNGAFQTGFNHNSGVAMAAPYTVFLQTGINGRTADVINSSWGFTDPGGFTLRTGTIDGIAQASRKTVVISTGNTGPNPNTIGGPASGFNSIAVGAVGTDTDSPSYNSVSPFSSRGPQTYEAADGNFGQVRARVDIVAPGENMTLALYGGTTGGNSGGSDPTGGDEFFYFLDVGGTSFAAPIVAGGAGLLADVAHDRFADNITNAIDGNVIKTVLLNSADKLPGWDNGQTVVNDVVTTTQALDFAQGAGRLNLNRAFDQYTAGTTDVVGVLGGVVETTGWDWGRVLENQSNDYFFNQTLSGGTLLTATLNWYVETLFNGHTTNFGFDVSDDYFTNLALELYRITADTPLLIAQSNAAFINTEHFQVEIPTTGDYFLRVRWAGERYDFGANNPSQDYGLAWSVTAAAPEPASFALLGLGTLGMAGLTLRKRYSRR